MPTQVTETRTTGPAPVQEAKGSGRMEIVLISPGWGSSGYYSEAVLKQAAEDRVWPKGTQSFIDHATETERYERPGRSVGDLAAVLEEDAEWRDGVGLVAPIRTFGPYREALAEMHDAIGMSITASAEADAGEAEGRKGMIITRLLENPSNSVDFVTRAGRGGRVLALIESAREHVREATQADRYADLDTALGAAYPRDPDSRAYVYVRDFDDAARTVWYERRHGTTTGTYEQSYDVGADDATVTLTGDPTRVVARTTYVPVAQTGTTDTSATTEAHEAAPTAVESQPPNVGAGNHHPPHTKENPMGSIQVDEARYAGLEEKAALVPALEARATAAETRADEAEQRALQAEAGTYARDFARAVVTKANSDLAEASVERIVKNALRAALPLDESGRLDTEAFTPAVEEARTDEETYLAQVAEASGTGRVRGVGATQTATTAVTEADVDQATARAFGRKGA